jgi:EAL domain-containing protein (putative c-di-GMP-specific phosphodiesterase class I)
VHPEQGIVSPATFIPLAEETGMIVPIGHWVIEAACAQIQAWQQHSASRNLILAVNISAKQFRQERFIDEVKKLMASYAINPKLLKLELTESLMLEDIDKTVVTMNALKAIGVQFSLDDFGTGYSSLQYLKRLPLDQLKIDQSFVNDIASDENDRAIVRTVIAMAQSLNVDVIAEGVETAEQQAFLLQNGCRQYLGYLFGKPMPIEEFNQQLHVV